jgi:hypothetical protein
LSCSEGAEYARIRKRIAAAVGFRKDRLFERIDHPLLLTLVFGGEVAGIFAQGAFESKCENLAGKVAGETGAVAFCKAAYPLAPFAR